MNPDSGISSAETEQLADAMLRRLFPLTRSLTGEGNRKTLEILGEIVPLRLHEIPSGSRSYDWVVPPEWRIREAWIKDMQGQVVVDFTESNLHVVNYSEPIHAVMSFAELCPNLHVLPNMPDAIPYRTAYYKRRWGFCMTQKEFERMDPSASYEVFIDSELLADGSLTYADALKPGKSGKEYILSSYFCHPSLANDNLSGIVLAVLLFSHIQSMPTRHAYRLILVPETIGAISYLSRNEATMKLVSGGYVITTVAGPSEFGYKESFLGNHEIDVAARLALRGHEYKKYPFVPDGSDERQYASPGFRIPTGTITKGKYYEYPEYHTSKDDLTFARPDALVATLDIYKRAISYLEMNQTYLRTEPHCEYCLGPRGLYPNLGGQYNQPATVAGDHHAHLYPVEAVFTSGEMLDALQWWMFAADGKTQTLDLAVRSGLRPETLEIAARRMIDAGLLVGADV